MCKGTVVGRAWDVLRAAGWDAVADRGQLGAEAPEVIRGFRLVGLENLRSQAQTMNSAEGNGELWKRLKWQCLIWAIERSLWQPCGEQISGRSKRWGGQLGSCPSKGQGDQSLGGSHGTE